MRFKKSRFRFYTNESGQILLIMILALVVTLTIGLAVASRAITNVKISKQNEESARAFQAAEAGIQEVLQGAQLRQLADFGLGNNTEYTASVVSANTNSFLLFGGSTVEQDIGSQIKLDTTSRNIRLVFGTNDQSNCSGTAVSIPPAVEVIVLQNATTMQKYLFDPCTTVRTANSTATSAYSGAIEGETLRYQTPVFTVSGIAAHVVPIYNSTKVGVEVVSGGALPAQGKKIQSVGTSGQTVRRLTYFETEPEIPTELFQYAILSQ